jgi:hypothetical protein
MPGFEFGDAHSFKANWESFLAEMEGIDADMAGILRANTEKIAAVVRQGTRNQQARASFNANVIRALDGLLTSKSKPEQIRCLATS